MTAGQASAVSYPYPIEEVASHLLEGGRELVDLLVEVLTHHEVRSRVFHECLLRTTHGASACSALLTSPMLRAVSH